MDDVKPALSSRAVWGAIIAGVAPILGLFGIVLSTDDSAALVDTAVGIVSLVTTAVTLGGVIMALIGRLRANTRIGGIFTADPAAAPARAPPSSLAG